MMSATSPLGNFGSSKSGGGPPGSGKRKKQERKLVVPALALEMPD